MANGRRITLKDIAEVAGFSKSAVSLALRNHPRLPKATRNRIHRVAEELGYRPDPALSALVSYRHGAQRSKVETLAWVTNWPTKDGWRQTSPVYDHYFAGARRRAEELGYRLEHFWLREPGISRARFEKILHTRNIRGLLMAPASAPRAHIDLTWSSYAAVTIGPTIVRPRLHVVNCSHFKSMTTVLGQLRRRGYRKVGFALPRETDARVEHAWLAAFLLDQQRHEKDPAVPPLFLRLSHHSRYEKWFRTHRPDAVVTIGVRYADTVRKWCGALGRPVPEDCGLAVVSNVPVDGEISGMHEHSEEIGETAATVLTGMLHRNEFGLPKRPLRTLLDGTWHEGQTVRHLRGRD